MDAQLIQCLLCDCNTIEESLMAHIQYNHLIYKKAIREVMYKLHYPPIKKGCCNAMVTSLEKEAKEKSKKYKLSPFLVESRKRKNSNDPPNKKKIKTEGESPQITKKPIVLTKPTPVRKRLAPTSSYDMMEDEPSSSGIQPDFVKTTTKVRRNNKKSGEVAYDDVYTRKENTDKHKSSVQKIRQLQQNELQCIMDQGTYVQCCDCTKWRLVKEYEDPSLVPEYWVCSMNKDPEANTCDKGEGDNVSSDEEYVSVEYSCGSMIWVKFPGYPWWPGMVDYCPEEEETFLVEEDPTVAAKHHVVFFDKTKNIARSWVRKEFLEKLVKTDKPPKPVGSFKNDSMKRRYYVAKSMADDALSLPRIERIEKYSFASLYTGKWKEASDDSEDQDRRSTEIDIDPRLVGLADFRQPPGPKKKVPSIKIKRRSKKGRPLKTEAESWLDEYSAKEEFQCIKCNNSVKLCRNMVKNHLRKHRMSLTDYRLKYDKPENQDKMYFIKQWLQNEDYLSQISEAAVKRRLSQDENLTEIAQTVDEEIVTPFPETVSPPPTNEELNTNIDDNDTIESYQSKDGVNILDPLHTDDSSDTDVAAKAEPRESLDLTLDTAGPSCKSPDKILGGSQGYLDELETETDSINQLNINDDIAEHSENEKEDDIFEDACDNSDNLLGESSQDSMSPMNGEDILNDDLDILKKNLENLTKQEKKSVEFKSSKKSRRLSKEKSATPSVSEHVLPKDNIGELLQNNFIKPPMSPELLIAIAVRNLDPHDDVGASCSDIVAFLSLHFPYFNTRHTECKDMVRQECGMGSSFESGTENFQMKAEINSVDRIYTYVQENKDKISDSMLEPEFLDTIIDRFVKKGSMVDSDCRQMPPFCRKMLTHIALLKLLPRSSLEQIVILLKFLFPALTKSGVMEAFRKEFLEDIAKSAELSAKVEKKKITFILKDKYREQVLEDIRKFSLENLESIGESLLSEKFFDIILPIF